MSHTTVTYKGSVEQRIDMRWLSKAITQSLNSEQILKETIAIGNQQTTIGELFNISGDNTSSDYVLENATQKMDYIGHALTQSNTLTVMGDCGFYTGAQLLGGRIKIEGNTHDFSGCGMSKGLIEISGNCGNHTGSAFTGGKKGMSGGTILVHGNSGNFTGELMRRGLIMIVGDIGDHCANRMIAGTITNLGATGKHVGAGMKRGTLLFPHKPENISPGFHDCGRHSLGYLTLLLHEIRRFKSAFQSLHPMRRRVQRYIGDTTVEGQGELLVWIG